MKENLISSLIMPVAGRFWLLIAAFVVLTGVFLYGASQLRIENDIMFMLPDDNDAKTFFLDTQERFGSSTGVIIAVEAQNGIYDGALQGKIREAGDLIQRSNQQIPANSIRRMTGLENDQALLVTSWLQNRVKEEGEGFSMNESVLSDKAAFEESLSESLPGYLSSDDNGKFISETAARIVKEIHDNPGLAEKLTAAVTVLTDKRGFNKGLWVDQIASIGASDTVWPEFEGFSSIDDFFKQNGFTDTASGRIYSTWLLENGISGPEDLIRLHHSLKSEIISSGVDPDFYEKTSNLITDNRFKGFAVSLYDVIRKAPKQIRTGPMSGHDGSGMEKLRQRLHSWPLFKGTLFSEDEKSTLIMVRTAPNLDKQNKALLLDEIRKALDKVFGDSGFKYHIAGEPVVDDEIGELMVKDIKGLFPFVTIIVMISLFLMFRNVPGVLYPLLTVMISLIWCAGSMGYADAPVSIVASALPVLLVAVGTAYAIHLTHSFQHGNAGGRDCIENAAKILDLTGSGVFMAGLTTVAGFASLGTNKIVPLRDFGIFIALGVVFALMISMYLVPSFMIRFGSGKKEHAHNDQSREGAYARIADSLSSVCFNRPRTVIAAYLLILAVSLAGLFFLKVEMNNITFFKEDSPIRMADTFVNERFAGTVGFSIVLTGKKHGDAVDPEIVSVIDELSDHLMKRYPEIGKVISIADFVKKMNQAFFFNAPDFYRLPSKKDLSGEKTDSALHAQYESYVDKYQRKDTKSLIDNEKRETVVAVQLKTASSSVVDKVAKEVDAMLSGALGKPLREKGVTYRCTGTGSMYLEANHLIVSGQLWSIAVSVILVFIVVAWIMRSFIYGLFSLVPLTVTIMINFGIMGFFAIALDVATSITACVAIGIGVDYGIHYLVRYRDFRRNGMDHKSAVLATAKSSGEAIIFNAVAVAAGFIVLTASAFVPLVNLGVLISTTMINSAFAAMTLLPAFLTLLESRLSQRCEIPEPEIIYEEDSMNEA